MSEDALNYVSLRITTKELDPEEISQALSLLPDRIHRRGDLPTGGPRHVDISVSPYESSVLLFRSKVAPNETLQAHLKNFVTILASQKEKIQILGEHIEIDFVCDVWGGEGFSLSSNLIQSIAEFGAALEVSIYSGDTNEE